MGPEGAGGHTSGNRTAQSPPLFLQVGLASTTRGLGRRERRRKTRTDLLHVTASLQSAIAGEAVPCTASPSYALHSWAIDALDYAASVGHHMPSATRPLIHTVMWALTSLTLLLRSVSVGFLKNLIPLFPQVLPSSRRRLRFPHMHASPPSAWEPPHRRS